MDQPTDTIMHEFHPSSMCTHVYMCVGVCVYCCEWERICVSDTEGELWFSHHKRSIPSCDLINNSTRDRAHDLYSAALQLTHSLQTDVHTCCVAYISSHPTAHQNCICIYSPQGSVWIFYIPQIPFTVSAVLVYTGRFFRLQICGKIWHLNALMFVCKQGGGGISIRSSFG